MGTRSAKSTPPGAAAPAAASEATPAPTVRPRPNDRTIRWVTTQVWLLHGLAILILVAMTWVVLQPTGEGIQFWAPGFAGFLVFSIWLIGANVVAWSRWWRFRPLVAIDLLAVIPVALVSAMLLFLPALLVAGLLILAASAASPLRDVRPPAEPRRVHPVVLGLVGLPVAVSAWSVLGVMTDPFLWNEPMYAIEVASSAGIALIGIILWLDKRPGTLLGASLASLYWLVTALGYVSAAVAEGRLGIEWLDYVVQTTLISIGAAAGVIVALADVRRASGRRAALAPVVVAAVTAILSVVAVEAAVLGPALALLIEPRIEGEDATAGDAPGPGADPQPDRGPEVASPATAT